MRTYPIMLALAGRRCVVVGAGPVGMRKARSLAEAGAEVVVIDPGGAAPAEGAAKGIELRRRPYSPEALAGASLVFACTDDRALNARIAEDARAAGALVNVADDPDLCDFYAAATIADADVVVAVGTGGSAPALAAALKTRLADALPEDVGAFAEGLAAVRQHLADRLPDPRRRHDLLKRLAAEGGYQIFRRAGPAGLLAEADRLTAQKD